MFLLSDMTTNLIRKVHTMRRILSGCLATLVLLIFPAVNRAADDDAKAIIAKAIKAHGGEELLTKMKAGQSKNKGKITLPAIGEIDFTQESSYMLPDKLRESMELNINGNKASVLTLVDGDKISIEANGNSVEITDPIKKALDEAKYLMKSARMVILLKDKGYELSSAGEIKVEGKTAVGVRIAAKDRKDVTLYFDKETGLLAKIEHRTQDSQSGMEINEERIILEYQKPSNAPPMPKKIVVKHDGKTYIEAEVIEGKLLESLDDGIFKK